ncbi:MAG TPA: sugar ABC transporter permease [Chloroflexota bacterium]|nr:sugar ABC transporter permease [Chloroflexota bacterium]
MAAISEGVIARRSTRSANRDWRLGYLLVLPVAIVIVGLIAYPFLYSIWMSLEAIRVGGAAKFIGLRNYEQLLFGAFQGRFWNSVLVTVEYTAGAEIGKCCIGIITALILHNSIRARGVFRTLLFVPWAVPAVVSAYSWRWMFDDRLGLWNVLLQDLGAIHSPILWLSNINLALWSVTAATIWQGTPFWTMTFLAGLQAIPSEIYEAAHVDGAGAWHGFWQITLPNLTPVIIVTVMLSTIWTSNGLQYVYILTNGGPVNATETFPLLAYTVGMRDYNLGLAAAVPLLFFPFFAVMIHFLSGRLLREAEV